MIRFAFVLFLLGASAAAAVQPDEQLSDPGLEHRAREISEGLRCLVCQNQSIDDSNAPLARDLRLLVRQRLEAGDSDQGVRDYLVARYGDFILLKPPFELTTALLWLTPLLVLIIGGGMLVRRARHVQTGQNSLSGEEEQELRSLLKSEDQAGSKPTS